MRLIAKETQRTAKAGGVLVKIVEHSRTGTQNSTMELPHSHMGLSIADKISQRILVYYLSGPRHALMDVEHGGRDRKAE